MSALTVEGAVARPGTLDFAALAALPEQIADVGTLVPERSGGAVLLRAVLAHVGADPAAQSVSLHASDGSFDQTAPLAALDDAVIVYRHGNAPLSDDAGGPLRFLVPEAVGKVGVDRCTNVKRLGRIVVRRDPA